MSRVFDCIVIGLGAHGSPALYHLAASGKRVLGIDRFDPPHGFGSSQGESRIIRQAYYEDPVYVPLLRGAYALWAAIEALSGKQLFLKTGGLMLGNEDAEVVRGSRLSAETYDIPYEYLLAKDIRRRFPAFLAEEGTVGLFEKEAGVLFPEECIRAWLQQAALAGADIHTNEMVTGIEMLKDSVIVKTSSGEYSAEKLILTAGAWTGQLLPELNLPLSVQRQVLYWFTQSDQHDRARFLPANMPVYIWEYAKDSMFYGFPDLGHGVKIGWHYQGGYIQPDELNQDVSREEIEDMSRIAGKYLGMQPIFDSSRVCMYTNTPDKHFVIDVHPGYEHVIVASPCSGHGFKFSSLIGKILSDMASELPTGYDLSPFCMTRLKKA